MKKLMLLGALALTVLAQPVFADEKPLKIGIEAAYPPFASKAPDGSIVGFDYDIGNALCAEMKIKCNWVEQEFDGLIPSLKVKKIDMALSSMTIKVRPAIEGYSPDRDGVGSIATDDMRSCRPSAS